MARIRVEAAKYLYSHGYSQQSIASLLHVSQPIVSNYLKRETKLDPKIPESIITEGENIGKQIGELLAVQGNEGIPQSVGLGCQSCKKLRQGGPTCQYHKLLNPHLEDNCTRCQTSETLIELQIDREGIINQLQQIYHKLIETTKYNYLIPEIGLQIVLGTVDMQQTNDIAGFPSRIIKRKAGPPSTEYPTFGASSTMSDLLLLTRKYFQNITGLAGVKTTEWLLEKLSSSGIPYIEYPGFDTNYENKLKELLQDHEEYSNHKSFLVVDRGSIGYEAISYIFATNPEELSQVFSSLLS